MARYARDLGWNPLGLWRSTSAARRGYAADFGPRGAYDRLYRGDPRRARYAEFERGDGRNRRPPLRAADIMTEEPDAVTADTSVAEAARMMKELDVGILPVVDNQDSRHLRGVVTDRDIAIRIVADGMDGRARISECMTRNVESCSANDRVQDVLDVMRSEQVRRVPITDRDGRLVGIVAQADLAVTYAGLDRDRQLAVEEALERISEPAQLQQGWSTFGARRR